MVKNSSSNAGDADSIPGQGTKIPDQGTKPMHCNYCAHTLWSLRAAVKSLHAAAEAWHSQINNKKNKKEKDTESNANDLTVQERRKLGKETR